MADQPDKEMEQPMKVNTILFDLDNTLVRCMVYYTFTRKNIYKILSKASGLTIDEVEYIFDEYESERIKKKDGFTKDAFLDSVNGVRVKIYEKLKALDADRANAFYESDAPLKLIQFTADVYDAPYTIYSDVVDTLKMLKSKGYSLYVVTKGDFYGQSKKAANMPPVFDGLFVLPHKSKYTWNGVLETSQLDRFSTVVVGDSVKDDINPALEVGLKAIRVNRENTVWVGDPEVKPKVDVPEIKDFSELLATLESL